MSEHHMIQEGEWLLGKPLASKCLFHSSTLEVGLALMLLESFNADGRLDLISVGLRDSR